MRRVIIAALLLLLSGLAHAADPGHLANSISPGTFGAGDFFFTGGDLGVGGSALYVNSSAGVGIGTTGPGAQLEVVDGTGPQIRLRHSPTQAVDLRTSSGDGNLVISNNGAGTLFTINADGSISTRLGSITAGTAGPLEGSSALYGTLSLTYTNNADDIQDFLTLTRRDSVQGASGQGTGILLKGTDAAGNTDDQSRIVSQWTDAASGSEDSAIGFEVRTAGGALDEVLRIVGGEVGIGTADPGSELDVNGSLALSASNSLFSARGGADASNSGISYGFSANRFTFGRDIKLAWGDSDLAGDVGFTRCAAGKLCLDASAYKTGDGTLIAGNVGIGTTQPNSTLHVIGDVNVTGKSHLNGYAGIGTAPASNVGTDASLIVAAPSHIGSGYPVFKVLQQDGTRALSVNNDGTVLLFGNTSVSGGSSLTISTAGAGTDMLRLSNLAGQGRLYDLESTSSGDLRIEDATTGDTRLLIDSSGEVGINESSPTDLLHITTGGAYGLMIESDDDWPGIRLAVDGVDQAWLLAQQSNGAVTLQGREEVVLVANSSNRLRVKADGRIGIATDTPTQLLDVRGSINTTGVLYAPQICLDGDCQTSWPSGDGGGWTDTSATTYTSLDVNVTNSSGASRFFVNSSSGNIGIGTTNPQGKLHVSPSADSLTDGIKVTRSEAAGFGANNQTAIINYAGGMLQIVAQDTIFPFGAGHQIAFVQHNGSDRRDPLRINQHGRVGVNATSPNSTLHVIGDANVSERIHTPEICLGGDCQTSWPGGSGGSGGWTNTSATTYTSLDVNVTNSSGASRFFVNSSSGNIGIGTTGPTQTVDVRGSINTSGTVYVPTLCLDGVCETGWPADDDQPDSDAEVPDTITVDGGTIGDNTIAGSAAWALTNNLNIDSNSLYIDGSSDEVGIGTASPDDKLHVVGGHIRLGDNFALRTAETDLIYGADDSVRIGSSGRIVVNSTSGSVGIGTTDPGTSKLKVAGTVEAVSFTGSGENLTDVIPSGVIVMWSGALASIPDGWLLCDGTSGTPDLRDRFILGASASEEPGATGGASTYTLTTAQLPVHSHGFSGTADAGGTHSHSVTGSTSTTGSHSHSYESFDSSGQYGQFGNNVYAAFQVKNTGAAGDHSHTTTGTAASAGSHTHTFSGTSDNTGSGSSIDNRPAYYKLAFIMKA